MESIFPYPLLIILLHITDKFDILSIDFKR